MSETIKLEIDGIEVEFRFPRIYEREILCEQVLKRLLLKPSDSRILSRSVLFSLASKILNGESEK